MYVLCTYYVIFLRGVYLSTIQSLLHECVIWNDVNCTSCLALVKEREELQKTLPGQQHFLVLL
jgi:hypothetical protein